uniref:Uncharacterized protein n=1 Tax=Cannabis sativa TaxID=3483 RepID=A0A803QGQ7_CANSA
MKLANFGVLPYKACLVMLGFGDPGQFLAESLDPSRPFQGLRTLVGMGLCSKWVAVFYPVVTSELYLSRSPVRGPYRSSVRFFSGYVVLAGPWPHACELISYPALGLFMFLLWPIDPLFLNITII